GEAATQKLRATAIFRTLMFQRRSSLFAFLFSRHFAKNHYSNHAQRILVLLRFRIMRGLLKRFDTVKLALVSVTSEHSLCSDHFHDSRSNLLHANAHFGITAFNGSNALLSDVDHVQSGMVGTSHL